MGFRGIPGVLPFPEAVLSYQTGFVKPEPEIYHHAIREHGLVPEETLYIDDLPQNIATGRDLGFRTWQYDMKDHAVLRNLARRQSEVFNYQLSTNHSQLLPCPPSPSPGANSAPAFSSAPASSRRMKPCATPSPPAARRSSPSPSAAPISSGKNDPFANILEFIDPEKYLLLPNTSGAMNAEEAVRLARLAAAAGLPKWVKLEIHPDPTYLLPDPIETLKAAEILVKEGFTVLPYINADPVLAKRLQDVGTATVMPLGAPIGSNRGVVTRDQIRIIIEQAIVPVVVDAGLGAPSHAAEAMELGADAVLVNTAIAIASDPVRMAIAFKQAVQAGREAYELGLPERLRPAHATSPLTGFLG